MYAAAASAMLNPLPLKDLDEVFPFLPLPSLVVSEHFLGFGVKKKEKMPSSSYKGFFGEKETPCIWTGKRKLGYFSYQKYESIPFF
jgi:hypothetical protein